MLPAGALLLLGGSLLWQLDLAVDQRIFDLLRLSAENPFATIARWISRYTGIATLGPVAILAAAWLFYRRRWHEALWLILVICSGRLAIDAMKIAFQEPRPPEAGRLAVVTSWSFPSSHSAGSMLTFLALALLAGTRREAMVALAIAGAALVGWSRIALGVHWPSDVAAGLGFGMLWVGVAWHWHLKARLPSANP